MPTHYWVNTISLSHVRIGVDGGFTQAGHGKASGLRKLQQDDLIVFYSPKTDLHDGASLQEFTAIGRIVDSDPYQVAVSEDFIPWRRSVRFKDVKPASIRPLIDELDFIRDKKRWGFPFRRGLFQIDKQDFEIIALSLGVNDLSSV